ncbi:hypothetical protein [Sphingomonas paucimobilis]|uniref:Uncharacterized protein n=1 Tax=Sphingomonas paucimobilis TaxID=13689 RepID=A0A7T3ABV2_SPHPI|nr:hypothetical protein [Sphingomonas paucimobilis]QPT09692.1 hypothetical protein I6G38_05400 [Sphingomonas paucimobilis]
MSSGRNVQYDRRGVPATIAEMISIASWKIEGEPIAKIAFRCRRPVSELRAIMEDRVI